MPKLKIALASTLLAMGLAAGNANAALSYPVSVTSVINPNTTFSSNVNFEIDQTSLVTAFSSLINTGSSLVKDVTISLVALSNNSTILSKTVSYSQADGKLYYSDYDFKNILLNSGYYTLKFSGDSYGNFQGLSVQTISVAAVPEPESIAMLGLGLGALLLRVKRKKANKSVMLAA